MAFGRIVFVVGGSGGIGKSSTSRALAQALSHTGGGRARVVLADANLGQQTQRSYHRIDDSRGLERLRVDENPMHALIPPAPKDPAGRRYAILPGPLDPRPDNMGRLLQLLGGALGRLARRVDWIIVDMDKIDMLDLDDPDTVAGGVMLPWVDSGGAGILFKLESQRGKFEDGLETLRHLNRPSATGVLGVVPYHAPDPPLDAWRSRIHGLGRLVGVEHWTAGSAGLLSRGLVGWPDGGEPDWLDGVLAWCGIHAADTTVGRGVRRLFQRRK